MYRHSNRARWKWLPTVMAAVVLVVLIFVIMPLVNHTTLRRPLHASSDLSAITMAPPPGIVSIAAENAPSIPELKSDLLVGQEERSSSQAQRREVPNPVPFLEPSEPAPSIRRALVFDVSDLDSTPLAIHRIAPEYPPELRYDGIEGVTIVEFRVDPDGRVKDLEIIESSHPSFATSVAQAVARWRFLPGTVSGETVTFRMRLPVSFRITQEARDPLKVADTY